MFAFRHAELGSSREVSNQLKLFVRISSLAMAAAVSTCDLISRAEPDVPSDPL